MIVDWWLIFFFIVMLGGMSFLILLNHDPYTVAYWITEIKRRLGI